MESTGAVLVLRLDGTLDRLSGERCRRLLSRLVTRGKSDVLLDLTATSHMHSTGLAALMAGLRTFAMDGQRATVVCPNRGLRAILEVCNVRRFARLLERFFVEENAE